MNGMCVSCCVIILFFSCVLMWMLVFIVFGLCCMVWLVSCSFSCSCGQCCCSDGSNGVSMWWLNVLLLVMCRGLVGLILLEVIIVCVCVRLFLMWCICVRYSVLVLLRVSWCVFWFSSCMFRCVFSWLMFWLIVVVLMLRMWVVVVMLLVFVVWVKLWISCNRFMIDQFVMVMVKYCLGLN